MLGSDEISPRALLIASGSVNPGALGTSGDDCESFLAGKLGKSEHFPSGKRLESFTFQR